MKYIFFIFGSIILVICLAMNVSAKEKYASTAAIDIGSPSYYAVCKITTKEGKLREGFLPLVRGGYDGTYKSGFGFIDPNTEDFEWRMFSTCNYSFEMGASYKVDPATGNRIYPPTYFLELRPVGIFGKGGYHSKYCVDHPVVKAFPYEWTDLNGATRPDTLWYNVLNKFFIYNKLPPYIYLPSESWKLQKDPDNYDRDLIVVEDILKFEVDFDPSKKWLNEIERVRDYENGPLATAVDYQEPIWLHEMQGLDTVDCSSTRFGSWDTPLVDSPY